MKRPNTGSERWFSIPQLLDLMKERSPNFTKALAGKPRKQQLQIVRRKVRLFLRRNRTTDLIKNDGRSLIVSPLVVKQLLGLDVPRLTEFEEDFAEWEARWGDQQSEISNLKVRVKKLEQILRGVDDVVRRHLEKGKR